MKVILVNILALLLSIPTICAGADNSLLLQNDKLLYRHNRFHETNESVSQYPVISSKLNTTTVVSKNDGSFLIDSNIVDTPASNEQSCPSICYDGTNYLVVWGDNRPTYLANGIYATRVSATSGEILDHSGIAICNSNYGGVFPNTSVAFDGTNYLVVWSGLRFGQHPYPEIFIARVKPTGEVIDYNGIPITNTAYGDYSPKVTFNGVFYFVVWEYHNAIWGCRVRTDGTVIDSLPIIVTSSWGES
ncbi:MAG: hypothetical protein Q7W05_10400, partial [Deltaproteobacteria bacterium]|nr:hypothetical protein [Deltaproteobacteria bacterium]